MSESVRDLMVRGIAAAKAGDKEEARFFLEWALRMEPTESQERDAWFYLSEATDDPAQKRGYLENILARNPLDPAARRALAIVDGRLNPDEIVDPDRMPRADDSPQAAHARRFTCPNCGARMAFAPGGALRCDFCGSRVPVEAAQAAGAEERDLLLALATAQGHARPSAQQVVACGGCGASFILPPETLSLACPFCASALAVQQRRSRELIPPDGVIPFAIARDEAGKRLERWLQSKRLDGCAVEPPVGFYLPIWAFHVGGEIAWRGMVREKGRSDRTVSGRESVMHRFLVPASRKLPPELAPIVDGFRLDGVAAYDPHFLADWPTETYEISVSDASLEARGKSLACARKEIVDLADEGLQPDSVALNSIGLAVESFRLILVPIWMVRFTYDGQSFAAVVNGQTGEVRAQRSLRGLRKWLADLLK